MTKRVSCFASSTSRSAHEVPYGAGGGASSVDGLEETIAMAKTSSIEKNKRRRKMTDQYKAKRAALKEIIYDRNKPMDERFAAQIKLTELPRNSSKTRIRNRCELTGRSRGFYRKLKLCRNQLRELASQGLIPGMTKSSW